MSDELAPEVVPYSAFLERRERRQRLAEELARRRLDVNVDEPAVRAPQSYRTERARPWLDSALIVQPHAVEDAFT
jgi:uncharacterized protein with von Willebrand factor type A (vWA) domain